MKGTNFVVDTVGLGVSGPCLIYSADRKKTHTPTPKHTQGGSVAMTYFGFADMLKEKS